MTINTLTHGEVTATVEYGDERITPVDVADAARSWVDAQIDGDAR